MSRFFTNIDRQGNTLLIREFDGISHTNRKVKFQPELYIPSREDDTMYKTLEGQPLQTKNFDTIYDAKQHIDQYKGVHGYNIYGNSNWITQYISREYDQEIKYDADKIRVFNFDIETISLVLDGFPDPHEATHPIVTFTIHDSFENKYHIWSYKEEYKSDDPEVVVHNCRDEKHLLSCVLKYWHINMPHVVTGWNIEGFDIPFIINRIASVLGEEAANYLSPWGKLRSRETTDNFKNIVILWDIVGVSILDYMTLYKNYTYTGKESYSLDFIANFELGAQKLDYSDIGTIKDLYREDHSRFCDYNIHDVRLVKELDEKMSLMNLILYLSYHCKQPYNDTFSPVKTWEALVFHFLRERGQQAHVKGSPKEKENFPGGFVKSPNIGKMHNWVCSLDLDGLYPHLIFQYNLGPDTIHERKEAIQDDFSEDFNINIANVIDKSVDTSSLSDMDLCVTANGQLFDTKKESFFSSLMKELYATRKKIKLDMLHNEQLLVDEKNGNNDKSVILELERKISTGDNAQKGIKVILNAGYGAIGQSSFQFYDIRIATAITTSGQLSIRWIEHKINKFMNKALGTTDVDYIVAIDTDSVYVDMEGVVAKAFPNPSKGTTEDRVNFLDKFFNDIIQKKLNVWYQELADYMNAREQKMNMSRENITSKSFWTAKKRYAMLVHDAEGVRYTEPKLKIMGLEIVKSSTPKKVREVLKEAVRLMLTKDEETVIDFVAKFKEEFKTLPIESIAYPRGVNNIQKYKGSSTIHAKGAPKQVKAALMYNHMIEEYGLTDERPIADADKIKFVDLKLPNHIKYEVIGFPSHLTLPKVFDLSSSIDYRTMYTKTFLAPMESMLHSVGWVSEKEATLESMYE